MREVGIIGVGHTKFGNLGRVTSRELITSAAIEAIEMANISKNEIDTIYACLLYTSPSPRDRQKSRMPSSA